MWAAAGRGGAKGCLPGGQGYHGGRSRKVGTLLGRGLLFDDAMKELSGLTLESIVIARRTAAAMRVLISRGIVQAGDFPLLLHIDDIISRGAEVAVPWDGFETETASL